MKIMRLLTAAVVASLLFGCATTFKPWNLNQVQQGMSRDQVVELLGEPDSVETVDGAERLYYAYTEELSPAPSVSLETQEGINRRVEHAQQTLTPTTYEVVLVDGKVTHYTKVGE